MSEEEANKAMWGVAKVPRLGTWDRECDERWGKRILKEKDEQEKAKRLEERKEELYRCPGDEEEDLEYLEWRNKFWDGCDEVLAMLAQRKVEIEKEKRRISGGE